MTKYFSVPFDPNLEFVPATWSRCRALPLVLLITAPFPWWRLCPPGELTPGQLWHLVLFDIFPGFFLCSDVCSCVAGAPRGTAASERTSRTGLQAASASA